MLPPPGERFTLQVLPPRSSRTLAELAMRKACRTPRSHVRLVKREIRVVGQGVRHDPHTRELHGFVMETVKEADTAITAQNAARNIVVVEKTQHGRARGPTPGRYYCTPRRIECILRRYLRLHDHQALVGGVTKTARATMIVATAITTEDMVVEATTSLFFGVGTCGHRGNNAGGTIHKDRISFWDLSLAKFTMIFDGSDHVQRPIIL
ncbi:hypothetical protein HD554DRAFT_2328019 [Boletus coccyginus]|nr:hypothetical protein HD554DRAFT_2328019 [Boletus coccyginus]